MEIRVDIRSEPFERFAQYSRYYIIVSFNERGLGGEEGWHTFEFRDLLVNPFDPRNSIAIHVCRRQTDSDLLRITVDGTHEANLMRSLCRITLVDHHLICPQYDFVH